MLSVTVLNGHDLFIAGKIGFKTKMLLSLQVVRLLEKELDTYKEKQAEPKPDAVSKPICK